MDLETAIQAEIDADPEFARIWAAGEAEYQRRLAEIEKELKEQEKETEPESDPAETLRKQDKQ